MRPIELDLHQMLEDIACDSYNYDEQARIVAEAAAIYRRASQQSATSKTAKKADPARIKEAQMTDALLQAMGALDDWSEEPAEGYGSSYVDGTNLDARQIMHRAASLESFASNDWGSMDILNDDLEEFLKEYEGEDDDDTYAIDDDVEDHDAEAFFAPGRGRHRSDSLSR